MLISDAFNPDDLDRAIVNAVKETDGIRMSALAEKTGKYPGTLRYRVLNLEAKGYLRTEQSHGASRVYHTGKEFEKR